MYKCTVFQLLPLYVLKSEQDSLITTALKDENEIQICSNTSCLIYRIMFACYAISYYSLSNEENDVISMTKEKIYVEILKPEF